MSCPTLKKAGYISSTFLSGELTGVIGPKREGPIPKVQVDEGQIAGAQVLKGPILGLGTLIPDQMGPQKLPALTMKTRTLKRHQKKIQVLRIHPKVNLTVNPLNR